MSETKYFPIRLKTMRVSKGLSQASLAKACGWSQSRIGNYESGRREPSFADLDKIAEALGIVPELLFSKEATAQSVLGSDSGIPAIHAAPASNATSVCIPFYGRVGDESRVSLPDPYAESCLQMIFTKSSLVALGISEADIPNLALISPWEQDMQGTLGVNSQIILDTSVSTFKGNGIYLFTWLGDLYLRRIEKLDSRLLEMIPDNPKYTRRAADADDLNIHAKVALIFNPQRP